MYEFRCCLSFAVTITHRRSVSRFEADLVSPMARQYGDERLKHYANAVSWSHALHMYVDYAEFVAVGEVRSWDGTPARERIWMDADSA